MCKIFHFLKKVNLPTYVCLYFYKEINIWGNKYHYISCISEGQGCKEERFFPFLYLFFIYISGIICVIEGFF